MCQDPPYLHLLGDERNDAPVAAAQEGHQRESLVDAYDENRPEAVRRETPG